MTQQQASLSPLKRANPSGSDALIHCIYDSSHELMQFMFGDKATAFAVLRKLYSHSSGLFSYRFGWTYSQHNEIKGAVLGYSRHQLKQQEFMGAIQLLMAMPLTLKAHLLTTVRNALEGYVPLPSEGAFYINNIAVCESARGQGIGTAILDALCLQLKQQGYRYIELDVTECNQGAIRFYNDYGFTQVSQSGSEELNQQHGLPILLRMRYILGDKAHAGHQPNYTNVIKEVSRLYPIAVDEVYIPGTIEQLQTMLNTTTKPISIGGGRYSMGGQIAHEGSLHIDMRGLNRILDLNVEAKTIRVQAGARWRDIQAAIKDDGLAVKIMQTYANFTVGGSLSVNCHGRYVGLGPLVLSVNEVLLLLEDGTAVVASPTQHSELFYGAIGGYGAIGIIVEVELSLTTDSHIERLHTKMPLSQYPAFFNRNIKTNSDTVFHNADMLPPHFDKVQAITWESTDKAVNAAPRKARKLYLAEKYMLWTITEAPFGYWLREYVYEPLLYWRNKITTRNDEANYDVAELEPISREKTTYVLQEYFIPVGNIEKFTPAMTEILKRYAVNTVNISIRHAKQDPGTLLAWAREEMFAFVLYYKQGASPADQTRVAIWTRELIEAAIHAGGCYYLPYQPHARFDQFHRAYPNATVLFALKDKWDPNYRFRHCLWEKYYRQNDDQRLFSPDEINQSEFRQVYNTISGRDNFYLFLQNIYHLYPEHQFHQLILDTCQQFNNDEAIYEELQYALVDIKPALGDIRYALPALAKQKREMIKQTQAILPTKHHLEGYLEIGTTGRYVNGLKKALKLSGKVFISNDMTPDHSLAEIAERGSIKPVGEFFALDDYEPIPDNIIADNSLNLITCYIGLHHCPPDKLDAYIASICRVLKSDGYFVLRDHDAGTTQQRTFCSLVHTVFNAGINVSWLDNQAELRNFQGIDYWIAALEKHGLCDSKQYLLQDHNPSLNTLMCFKKHLKEGR
ncbi:GNAT family N-acetyltransferase [Photobacterium leiognathi]|uniref:GNAT family N-acetyltransferase n=1 Tax=Photobacterium leiognathi TaxID=553611 RepID=UPI003DA078C6